MISIVYDVHLLGDYTPDNSDFDGVQDFSSAVGDLINSLRKLDEAEAKVLIKDFQTIANNSSVSIHQRAESLLDMLSEKVPAFLKKARNGSLARRFQSKGITFRMQPSKIKDAVYMSSPTSSVYHKTKSCPALSRSANIMSTSEQEAVKQGKRKCSKCR